MSAFDKEQIEIPCENCGSKHKKTIRWVKGNKKLTCTCGTVITINSDQFRREIDRVEKSITDLTKSFKKLGK